MKLIVSTLASVALFAVTGCDSSADRNRERALENQADAKEQQAENQKKAAEKAADATEDAGKKQADAEAERIREAAKQNEKNLNNQADALREQK